MAQDEGSAGDVAGATGGWWRPARAAVARVQDGVGTAGSSPPLRQ